MTGHAQIHTPGEAPGWWLGCFSQANRTLSGRDSDLNTHDRLLTCSFLFGGMGGKVILVFKEAAGRGGGVQKGWNRWIYSGHNLSMS